MLVGVIGSNLTYVIGSAAYANGIIQYSFDMTGEVEGHTVRFMFVLNAL